MKPIRNPVRDQLQARQNAAALKQRWKEFSTAVKDKNTECFCAWVHVPEARNWKAPKFWNDLKYCKSHGKMGARLGKLQERRRQPARTVIIDLGNSSDEELFDTGVQNLASQGPNLTNLKGRNSGTVSQKTHHEIETFRRKPRYTAETIASDVLRAAGIHPTRPPLNWSRDHRLLDIQYHWTPERI